MDGSFHSHGTGYAEFSPEERERALRANGFFSALLKENSIRVSTWRDFASWKEYVDGKLSDPELQTNARNEMEDLALRFGKYVIIDEEEPEPIRDDTIKRARAKLANKIYKKVCEDAGLSLCFFSNFAAWSDYVKGVIGESEFYEQAKEEVRKMMAKAQEEQRH